MFPVHRYDPRKPFDVDKTPSKRQKRGGHQSTSNVSASDRFVIAPQVDVPKSNSIHRDSVFVEEAFDDLDIIPVDDIIHEQEVPDDVDQDDIQKEIQLALQMSSLPIEQAAKKWKLASFLVDNLKRDGFDRFFPIQALVIPDVIMSERRANVFRVRDICISAPTGSGKTLSYCLPILNSLATRQICRLRALVILPNRDLATQVFRVFNRYVEGSDLKVGLAIGQSDFTAEQKALTLDLNLDRVQAARHRLSFELDLETALEAFSQPTDMTKPFVPSRSGQSAVDVLVCTPGRLVDHLDQTTGFTLQHLRYLVVDEADRLLSQRYHNWIDRVIQSTNAASVAAYQQIASNDNKLPPLRSTEGHLLPIEPITWRRFGTVREATLAKAGVAYLSMAASVCRPVQLRKFLVSATLTRDPQKLAMLHLQNPKRFDAHQFRNEADVTTLEHDKKYSTPDGLQEYTVECTAEQKPLVLLALLLERLQLPSSSEREGIIAIFTSSVDSTHRLTRLLQLLWIAAEYGEPSSIAEFSSAMNQRERSALIERCNDSKGGVSIVVCSDGMSRGMDIGSVSVVINYDVPRLAKVYLHRVGRTARGGRAGMAISLLKCGQVKQFAMMRRLIHAPDRVQAMGVKKNIVRDAISSYRDCIQALREVLDSEATGELGVTDADLGDYLTGDDQSAEQLQESEP